MLWLLFLLGVFLHQSYALIRNFSRATTVEKVQPSGLSRCPFLARIQMARKMATVSERPVETKSPRSVPTSEPMPWKRSIKPTRDMTYKPMLDHHLEVLERLGMESVDLEDIFTARQSTIKEARIGSMCFQNEKFRKVRLTYFDGGDNVQVFNSVWYPSYEYDLPILGMDLISIGQNRVLNVIDFQPLDPSPEYAAKYIDHLAPIRAKYPDLQGTLSGKIYHDALFFSPQMLFGRMTDESKVLSTVFPAYQEYLAAYLALSERAVPDRSAESQAAVRARQSAYDAYNAVKDPAVGLYDAYFGKDWSNAFVHDFLFSNHLEGGVEGLTSGTGAGKQLNHSHSAPLTGAEKSAPPMNNPVHKFSVGLSGNVELRGGLHTRAAS